INTAISSAAEDAMLKVAPGDYVGDLKLDVERLTLKSIEKHGAIIEGFIGINVSDVTVENFHVDYTDSDRAPVDLMDAEGVTIRGNKIEGGSDAGGISTWTGTSDASARAYGDVLIEDNEINNGPIGLVIGNEEANVVIRNNIMENPDNEGIWTMKNENAEFIIQGNTVNDAGLEDVKIVDEPVSVNNEISPYGMIMTTLRENEGVESVNVEWMEQTGTQEEMGEYVVYDSGRSEYNEDYEARDRPYIEYEIIGTDIDLTFNNPTNHDYAFDHRIDFEEGKEHNWTGNEIDEGELKGEPFGEVYNTVTLSEETGNAHEENVSGDEEVWTGLRLGAEQNDYMGWIIFERK
ncbi:hypothetical protein D5R95_01175, partial [Methanosalsum natronophilum]